MGKWMENGWKMDGKRGKSVGFGWTFMENISLIKLQRLALALLDKSQLCGILSALLGLPLLPSTSKVTDDHELLPEDLEQLVSDYKTAVHLELGVPFPEDPEEQLWGAIGFLPVVGWGGSMWGPQMAGAFSGEILQLS